MAVLFACSGCGAKYEVGDELAGKRILCRQCQQRGVVASAGGAATSMATVDKPTRRSANWILLSILGAGSIGTGALLTRWRAFRHWHPFAPATTEDERQRGPGQRRNKDGKDDKGSKAGPAT